MTDVTAKSIVGSRFIIKLRSIALIASVLSISVTIVSSPRSQEFLSSDIIESLARPGGIGRSSEMVFPSMEGQDSDFVRATSARIAHRVEGSE